MTKNQIIDEEIKQAIKELTNMLEELNLSEIQIQQLASSNAKLKCLIQILSPEDEDPDEDEWIKFNTIN